MNNFDWNKLLDGTEESALPAFFLICNFGYDTEHAQLPLESWRMSGRCIEVAHTFDDATKRVPKARLPRDPKKQEALLLRFGTRHTLKKDGQWREGPASFGYSLNPEAKNELMQRIAVKIGGGVTIHSYVERAIRLTLAVDGEKMKGGAA